MSKAVRLTGWKAILLLPVAALVCSCGGQTQTPVYPVRGKVFYLNKPTPRAVVYLHPLDGDKKSSVHPSGVVGEDGSFQLTTFRPGDGAPAGRYAVTVFWMTRAKRGDDDGRSLLPVRYCRPEMSNLFVEVKPGTNELAPIQLTR